MTIGLDPPRCIVTQIGARHHYAIPRMLEKAGLLSAFYTDSNAVKGLGLAATALPSMLRSKRLSKLTSRVPIGVPALKIRYTDAVLKQQLIGSFLPSRRHHSYVDDDLLFDAIVSQWGFQNANTLYAMQKHGTGLLDAARKAGLNVVVDVFITPLSHRIVEEERQRFPDLERPFENDAWLEAEEQRTSAEINRADLLLCPGHNVVEGLATFRESHTKHYAVVPYGCGASFHGNRNFPKKGTILFAGTADLRKGIHYLGMAAESLNGRNYDFRVAGGVTDAVAKHPKSRYLNFLGRLPREQMLEEFLRADVFVLPTLAEGCASVVHEAVMAGCPVITTPSAGTLVKKNFGGILVPERNPEALAAAIESVINDREQREYLAGTCADLAKELGEDRWATRLIEALSGRHVKTFDSRKEWKA